VRRVRRYRQGWLLVPALVASAVAQTGGAVAYETLRPPPPPQPWSLTVDVGGEGQGGVLAQVVGDLKPLGSCTPATAPCRFDVPANRYVTITAIRGEKMTFEGWRGCEPYAEDVLGCELMAFRSREVTAVFGKVPDTVEVAWLENAIRPPELPAAAQPKPKKKKDKIDAERLEEDEVKVALVKPVPPPPPIIQPPQPPPPPTPPPPPQEIPQNMTAVEVDDDEHVVEKAPDDATKISDKNRDVAEETRATETNLDKESKGETPASAKSDDTTSPEVGGPDDKIAHLEEVESEAENEPPSDHSGEDDSARGQIVGEGGHDGEGGTGDRQPGLLAMRGIGGRGALLGDRIGDGKKEGVKGAPGLKTDLDFDAYERIIGKDKAEEERVVARARMGARTGRWERKLEAVKSSLENFVPDVRPGNQTALKTRAHPFAVYVARMHRRIHERWGFGFLDELDGKSSSHPLNNMELVTMLELSINPDGTLYKTTVIRTSGRTDFDVAAIASVMDSAPFEKTPTEIRSVDQRVYLRWAFFRGPRQCHPSNVEYYILDSIPGGVVPLEAGQAAVAATTASSSATPDGAGDKALAPPKPLSNDRNASYAANMWVSGLTSNSVKRLMKVSAVPFSVGGQPAASTTGDLQSLYEGLLGEIGGIKSWELVSPVEFSRKTGLPASVGSDDLIVLVVTTQEKLGVVLAPHGGEYRAVQLIR
jgi:hypothetical protein